MKRLATLVLILPVLTILGLLAGYGCSSPPPSASPSPTPTGMPASTATPTVTSPQSAGPRITVVPSATRLPTQPGQTAEPTTPPPKTTAPAPSATPVPTDTDTPWPADTATPPIIDAGATDTPEPTATLPDSPLASPTQEEEDEPLAEAPGTPTATATPDEADDGTTPPATETVTPDSTPEAWPLEDIYTYVNTESMKLALAGQLRNASDSHQRLMALLPRIYEETGLPLTDVDDVDAPPDIFDYNELVVQISLAPDATFPFNFVIDLPGDVSVDENYRVVVEAEPSEPDRDDLYVDDYSVEEDWPLFVEGIYRVPDQDLTDYVAVVIAAYDNKGRIIGLGWFLGTESSDLSSGRHDFELDVWPAGSEEELKAEEYEAYIYGR